MPASAEQQLELSPVPLALRQISPWLSTAIRTFAPARREALLARAELAVHEACMNTIRHARLPPGTTLTLRSRTEPGALVVWICDPGIPFDPTRARVDATRDPAEGGFGLRIIRSLSDEIGYRRGESGNELRLRFDIGGAQ